MMKYKINTQIKLIDRIINFFTFKKSEKVKGYCGHCGRAVFRLENKWCKIGLCVYCWEMINFNTKGD